MRFVIRSAAHRAAKSRGYQSFRTEIDPKTGTWKLTDVPYPSPAEAWAQGKDYVAWVETAFVDHKATGVVIVHITTEEVAMENIPTEYIVEPVTPELWNLSQGTRRGAKDEGVSKPQGAPRAKSEVAAGVSPTKLVWQLADKAVGKAKTITKDARSAVIADCIAAGVNKATANTQMYRWAKARGVSTQ